MLAGLKNYLSPKRKESNDGMENQFYMNTLIDDILPTLLLEPVDEEFSEQSSDSDGSIDSNVHAEDDNRNIREVYSSDEEESQQSSLLSVEEVRRDRIRRPTEVVHNHQQQPLVSFDRQACHDQMRDDIKKYSATLSGKDFNLAFRNIPKGEDSGRELCQAASKFILSATKIWELQIFKTDQYFGKALNKDPLFKRIVVQVCRVLEDILITEFKMKNIDFDSLLEFFKMRFSYNKGRLSAGAKPRTLKRKPKSKKENEASVVVASSYSMEQTSRTSGRGRKNEREAVQEPAVVAHLVSSPSLVAPSVMTPALGAQAVSTPPIRAQPVRAVAVAGPATVVITSLTSPLPGKVQKQPVMKKAKINVSSTTSKRPLVVLPKFDHGKFAYVSDRGVVHGEGLKAKRAIEFFEDSRMIIGYVGGQPYDFNDPRIPKDKRYLFLLTSSIYLDGSHDDVGLGAKVNECFDDEKVNVRIVSGGKTNLFVEVVLLKSVKKGDEFLTTYGKEYWTHESNYETLDAASKIICKSFYKITDSDIALKLL